MLSEQPVLGTRGMVACAHLGGQIAATTRAEWQWASSEPDDT